MYAISISLTEKRARKKLSAPYKERGVMMRIREAINAFGQRLIEASLYATESVLGTEESPPRTEESEEEACRRAHIAALPVVMAGMASVVLVGAGHGVMRLIDDGVELVVDAINIPCELILDGYGLPIGPYEGPESAVLHVAMGIAAAPLVLTARFAFDTDPPRA